MNFDKGMFYTVIAAGCFFAFCMTMAFMVFMFAWN